MNSFGEPGKKKMKNRIFETGATGFLLLAMGMVPAIRAEVSVNSDERGNYRYLSYLVTEGTSSPGPWTPIRIVETGRLLNPHGDLHGDGIPAFVDHPGTGQPLVVWSRNGTGGSQLVWSSWEGDGWSPERWVASLNHPFEDRNPRVGVDPEGTIHLVWWRQEDGEFGRVYWSRFLPSGEWTEPARISSEFDDARYPRLLAQGSRIAVQFRSGDRWNSPIPLWGPFQGSGFHSLGDSTRAAGAEPDYLTDDPDILP